MRYEAPPPQKTTKVILIGIPNDNSIGKILGDSSPSFSGYTSLSHYLPVSAGFLGLGFDPPGDIADPPPTKGQSELSGIACEPP